MARHLNPVHAKPLDHSVRNTRSYELATDPVKGLGTLSCLNPGSRNANIYGAEIASVVAGSAQTFKQLGIQRAFSAYVQNRTDVNRFFRLTLIPDSDVIASFHQFDPSLTRVDVQILAHSSTAVTVYLTRINPDVDLTASARMEVVEIEAAVGGDGQFLDLEGGLATELRFNPDPTIRSSPARS